MMNGFKLLGLAVLLASCNQGGSSPPPLAGAKMGGAFTLTGEDGKAVRDTDFTGKYRLVYFGYSYCPDVCPVDLQKLMMGLKALEQKNMATADKIQPLFITVDPERDTPAVVREFTANFHPRLIGLTGTPEEIAKVASAYGIYYRKGNAATPGAYMVDHSRQATLYGPKGEPIALIDETGTPVEIADELVRWVK
jgi:protein SCO1